MRAGTDERKLRNYTTKTPASRSIEQVQEILRQRGATAVLLEYGEAGRIKALSFRAPLNGTEVAFRLPLRWQSAKKALIACGCGWANRDEDRVYRVAWRILRDWLAIQMTIYEIEMADLAEIFLPYAIRNDGRTVYENAQADPRFLLGGG